MSVMNPPMPLRLLQPPLPLIGSHNGRELFLPCLRPATGKSALFHVLCLPRRLRRYALSGFATQFVCGDHKNAVRFRIRNIYHPDQSAALVCPVATREPS